MQDPFFVDVEATSTGLGVAAIGGLVMVQSFVFFGTRGGGFAWVLGGVRLRGTKLGVTFRW